MGPWDTGTLLEGQINILHDPVASNDHLRTRSRYQNRDLKVQQRSLGEQGGGGDGEIAGNLGNVGNLPFVRMSSLTGLMSRIQRLQLLLAYPVVPIRNQRV